MRQNTPSFPLSSNHSFREALFFIPRSASVENHRQDHGNRPADGPGTPDAERSEGTGKDLCIGKFADPLADKLLTTVAFIYMMRDGVCSPVVLCIILAREFAVSGLRMVAAGAKDGKVIAANMWGKVKTVLQMLSIIFYFFGMSIASMSATGAEQGVRQILVISISMMLCWLVAAVTAISGIKYLWDNRSFINTAK